jgi:hypothetical protein
MKRMMFYLFLFLSTFFACEEPIVAVADCNSNPCAENACEPDSCRFQDTTSIDTNPDSTFLGLDTAWTSALTGRYGPRKAVQGNKNIYLTCIDLSSDSHLLIGIEKKTGRILWTFSDPNVDYFADIHYHEATQTVIAQRWGRIVALNGTSGQVLSNNHVGSFSRIGTYGKLLGQYYYVPVKSPDKTVGGAIRSHISDLQNWQWAYKMHIDSMDGIEPDADSFNHWYDPQTGDEILVLQHRMAFPTRRIDLLAYNLTADSILWWHKDLDPNGNSNIQQINIFDDKVVFFSARLVHCVDLPSGNFLWQSNLNESEKRNFILASAEQVGGNTLVIANESSSPEPPFGTLYVSFVDLSTGQVVMEITGERPVHVIAYNHLLFMSGKNRCYDLRSNEFLWDTNIEEIYHGLGYTLVDFDKKIYYGSFGIDGNVSIGAWEIPDEWF